MVSRLFAPDGARYDNASRSWSNTTIMLICQYTISGTPELRLRDGQIRSRAPQPDGCRLRGSLLRPLAYLLIGQCAERVVDDDRSEILHAERGALHLCLVQELGGDDHCRGAAGCFETDAVMRTARRARPSIADRRQDDIVGVGDCRKQGRIGVL